MRDGFLRNIIGVDLDSVLAYTERALDAYIKKEFNLQIDWENDVYEYKLENLPCITEKQANKLVSDIENGVVLDDIIPHNYAEYAVNKLRNNNCEVFIITSRPHKLTEMTINWLDKWSIYYDKLMLIHSSEKWKVVKEYSMKAFVEDKFETLVDIYDRCGQLDFGLFVVNQPWNKRHTHDAITRVEDVSVAVDKILKARRIYYEQS